MGQLFDILKGDSQTSCTSISVDIKVMQLQYVISCCVKASDRLLLYLKILPTTISFDMGRFNV